MRPRTLAFILELWLAIAPPNRAACEEKFETEPPLVSLNLGAAQIFDPHREFFWGIEYRPALRFFHLAPWLFFGTGKNAEFYAAAGAMLNIPLGDKWVLSPSFGGGYYNASAGLDLGFDAEFRTGIEVARRLNNQHRLGLAFAHLSNGSLGDKNPGTETIGIAYSIPLGTAVP